MSNARQITDVRRTRTRRVLTAASILVMPMLLSACLALHRVTFESAVGTWVYEESDEFSTLIIRPDGTFEAWNFPAEFITEGWSFDTDWDGRIDWDDSVTARGTVTWFGRDDEFAFHFDEPSDFQGETLWGWIRVARGEIFFNAGYFDFPHQFSYVRRAADAGAPRMADQMSQTGAVTGIPY
ncbi:hypothetical protein M2152_001438 [Microbacteriaceae bacterium SG_E_30_P1]|uniref:Uncharacterized protein n=1 Tax=Antiquaquibacter oligotrophicus TaxID=2880260 RepID=A0ABT6KN93_9MICO|nr:hypothetical protein [Antiquaquibacter oligotrophicus]MDH6181256.1 hypothetical protein [Antiquaquibacter oligotrophicus]UDF13049.1 hypothetical protein LH407_12935 [Antiquaquibacter oligotrophicus]